MEDNKNISTPDIEKSHWKLGIFYFNKDDKRIFPPKRTGLGWTVNFANPLSIGCMVLIIVAFIALKIALRRALKHG